MPWVRLVGIIGLLVLAACRASGDGDPGLSQFAGFGANDLKARSASARLPGGTGSGAGPAQVYPGTDGARTGGAAPAAGPPIIVDGSGFQINFDNADIGAVAKSILTDILGANYAIDSRVSGQVSLSSARPVPKSALVPILESALRSIGATIVNDGTIYRIMPADDAAAAGSFDVGRASPGRGVTIYPPRFVAPAVLASVLETFASRAGMIKADAATGFLVLQGSSQERAALLDAAASVDTDYLRSRSVGVFPLANSSPDQMIAELTRILDSGDGGVARGMVQFQPMTRINGILVVARQARALAAVQTWIARLDRSDPVAGGVRVYRLQYANATSVAGLLNSLLNGQAPSGRDDERGTRDSDFLRAGKGGDDKTSAGDQTPSGGGQTSDAGTPPAGSGDSQSGDVDLGASGGATPETPGTATGGDGLGGQTSGRVRITADPANNALLVVASASDYRIVEAAIRQMDREPAQVAIEATIAEVRLNDDLQFGVQAYLRSGRVSGGYANGTSALKLLPVVPGGNIIFGSTTTPDVILSALQTHTAVKVLSSPSLMVLENQPAVLKVGDQVAIKTKTATDIGNGDSVIVNSIDYKDTGIILNVLPRVRAGDLVNLQIDQEISSIVANSGGSDGLTPTISQRRVSSQVAVNSGQTVLLAGLISDTRSRGRDGLPGAGPLSFLSDLFSKHEETVGRTELIIFIKPQIVHNQYDAQTISEEFRERLTMMRATSRTAKP